jgi:hypothetical protein
MQRRLQGSSAYRGAEEAFDMFYADRGLQDFLRAYAVKEDIVEFKGLKFEQAGEDRKIHVAGHCDDYGPIIECPHLYIGPRQKGDSALVVRAQDEDLYSSDCPCPESFRLGEVKKIKGIWNIVMPQQITYDRGFFNKSTYRVSQAPFFQKEIDKQDILEGLEKAVIELTKG